MFDCLFSVPSNLDFHGKINEWSWYPAYFREKNNYEHE